MMGSAFFSYPDPDINHRTLGPAYVSMIALAMVFLARIRARSRGLIHAFVIIMPILFLILKIGSAQYTIRQLHLDGQGYLSDTWQNSETIAALQEMDTDSIYSDNIGAIYFFTGKYAFNVPVKYDAVTKEIHKDFQISLNLMVERLERSDGYLVLFNQEARLPEFAEPDVLTEALVLIGEYNDGSIYTNARLDP
jgi:hypothetical protein